MSLRNRSKRITWALAFWLLAASCLAAPPSKTPEFVPGSWTLVLLPDTQNYAEKYPGLLLLQTRWIAKNKDKYDIRYVLGLGDITNRNTDLEWRRAQDAFAELDGQVPYAIVPGNHDYAPHSDVVRGATGLDKHFPPSKFRAWPTFGGVMEEGKIANSYHFFSAGGVDWIILALEWAPRNATVAWANGVLAKYPNRKAILVTHAYLSNDSNRLAFAKYGKWQAGNPHEYERLRRESVNDGEELWQKLVRKNNFALVFCGHVYSRGEGFLASKNDRGATTHQMLCDYQNRALGGEGYLRLVEFLPDGKTVQVVSYSPLYDKYLDADGNQFTFKLEQ